MKTVISPRYYRDKLKLKQQTVILPKGMTDRKLIYLAASKKAVRDFRGLSYDAKTGKTILT